MSQPPFSDGPPVPLMVAGEIDPPTLAQLFVELATVASVCSIRAKGDAGCYSGADPLSPAAALKRLLSGSARAVQVRYRYDGHEWADTILAVPAGFRVIRTRYE